MANQNQVLSVATPARLMAILFPAKVQVFTLWVFLWRWIAARCIGMLVSLLIVSLPALSSGDITNGCAIPYLGPYFVNPLAAVVGIVLLGLIASSAEWWVLRQYARRAEWWVAATTVGVVAAALYSLWGYFTGSGAGYCPKEWGWGVYPLITAVPLAITQTFALLLMSDRRLFALLWLLARPIAWSLVSFMGGFAGLLVLSAFLPKNFDMLIWHWALFFTLFAGLPATLASGLCLWLVLRPKGKKKDRVEQVA